MNTLSFTAVSSSTVTIDADMVRDETTEHAARATSYATCAQQLAATVIGTAVSLPAGWTTPGGGDAEYVAVLATRDARVAKQRAEAARRAATEADTTDDVSILLDLANQARWYCQDAKFLADTVRRYLTLMTDADADVVEDEDAPAARVA